MSDECRVADNGDGTWRVGSYHPNTGSFIGFKDFPTEDEARWYAHAMNTGSLDIGAMMRVHDKRLAKARNSLNCPCSATGRPRNHCWVGVANCLYDMPRRDEFG